jgi:hypothetical protein
MSDSLSYVRGYLPDATIVDVKESGTGTVALPPAWTDILTRQGTARVQQALAMWARFEADLPELLSKLRDRLVSIDILRYGSDQCSLLYGVQGKQRILYYEAKNPLQRRLRPNVQALWDRLPASVRDFYALQDGWFYLASHLWTSLGLEEE